MDSGVKVVGAAPSDEAETPPPAARKGTPTAGDPMGKRFMIVSALAVLGLVGTLVFGLLWGGSGGGNGQQDPAVLSTSRTFLSDLTNFNAKTVDQAFSSVTDMATGSFASQAQKFFNSAIRVDLEKALADSRGQIRAVYVQSLNGNSATVYGVVDQLYVNSKITTPQADVLRILLNLQQVGGTWKISNVTVLEGANPASAGSASGSAGSTVPGQ
jgi:hypothetical protein